MTDIDISIESWDSIEDYSTHKTFIDTVSEHNVRCELQRQENQIWGQLYDVTNSEVINEGTVFDEAEWEMDEVSSWVEDSLETYFKEDENGEE